MITPCKYKRAEKNFPNRHKKEVCFVSICSKLFVDKSDKQRLNGRPSCSLYFDVFLTIIERLHLDLTHKVRAGEAASAVLCLWLKTR